MHSRRSLLSATAALALAQAARAQSAPAFPARPLTWVVPYPAGGFGDALSRLLAQKLGEGLGQTVIVENKPGAGGQIGAAYVKQQPADGHTLLYGDLGPFAMNAGLYPKLNYDTLKDFAPLTRLLNAPLLVVVPVNSPIQNWADLLRAAATQRGLNYGSYGIGSQPHIWGEMLKRQTKGNFTHVAYKGAAPAVQDLIGGQIDMMLDVVANSIPMVRERKLKAVALVGARRRLAQLPDVPTLTELGMPELDVPGWTGVVVRRGTPQPVVDRLHAAVVQAVQSPEVAQRYGDLGLTVAPSSQAEFAELIRSETARWGQVIREAHVTLD
ncbi:tripartite tricarboxylate transporter substrate binding protein [Pseudorhodoferax sp. Leaf265]|uniref:Bug family tripartite tricarboxylate transporter substrate binding protein n=1 Tax=Pseudorhodoferax sp. Leaf265 TaxID=1736315 RepID=UPI0006F582CC|nr:tripartite tricarboxylate transporter substrate binding protein [Pseudorhodoferax sp. Leaf265]KQP15287.1 ABC transporter substrate-binding protein [Pseudorhodoferax sp. Leaf265]